MNDTDIIKQLLNGNHLEAEELKRAKGIVEGLARNVEVRTATTTKPELKAEDIKTCCDKPMFYMEDIPAQVINGGSEITESKTWLCLECGMMITHKEEMLDKEEVQNYKENYEDAIEKWDEKACDCLMEKSEELQGEADDYKRLTLHREC